MENPNHRIDEIFRQRLHDAEVPPPPFVWPAVEHELQKRRRRWVLWLFAFGTLSACVWLWRPLTLNNNGYMIGAVETNEESNPSQGLNSTFKAEAPTNSAEALHDDYTTSAQAQETTFASAETAVVPVNDAPKKGQTPATARSAVKGGASEAQTPTLPALKPYEYAQTEPIITSEVSETAPEQPEITPLSSNIAPLALPYSVASARALKEPLLPRSIKSNARRKKIQPKLCYDFARHPSAWLLDVYAGPSFAQRSLTSRSEFQPYLNQRLATERRSVAMNAGVRASFMFNRNFLVRTGLHYDQVTEVFEFIDPTSVTYILKFNAGNPIPDTLGVQYGENYLKTYNRYVMLDVPLMVGVEMRRGRSGFSINAGLTTNVLFHKRGVIIDPNTKEPARFGPVPDEPKNIGPDATLTEPVFRTHLGLSATASIQWYWHLTPKFRVFAEPTFRQILRPVSLKTHPVEHRYGIIGVRLGATKIF